MDVHVDGIEVQELYQYTLGFDRSGFDPDQLAGFLNKHRKDEPKWSAAKAEPDDKDASQVVIENVRFDGGSPLLVKKMTIDENSILMIGIEEGRTLTEEDEVERVWTELTQCFELLRDFYKLPEDFFTGSSRRSRNVYLTKTPGAKFACKFERLLSPELMEVLNGPVRSAYEERRLNVLFHPYQIAVKIHTSPLAEDISTLSPLRVKTMIARDDLEIGVQKYDDYEEMIVTFGSQMPLHSHVRALRSLAAAAAKLGE